MAKTTVLGGIWRYDQMEKIAAYLEELLPEATILM